MSGEGKVVCVTGASGYIGSWLVRMLLERGYTVKASVRAINNPTKTGHLASLDGAKERLHLFQADLLEEGSFDPIVEGCEGVFHLASPVRISYSDPKVDIVEPAVKGTLNVLQACARVKSIKRVVLTSSMTALQFNQRLKDGVMVDESWCSDPSYCEEHKLWYALSKTLAENVAWEFTREHGIDMIAIHPGTVFGPILQPYPSLTAGFILNLVNGVGEQFRYNHMRWVDVRDAAYAHVLALEIPSASGRYCLVERFGCSSEIIKTLQELYPTLQLPDKYLANNLIIVPEYKISNVKAKGLGIEFIPLEICLKDTIESFKQKDLVSF